jgi:hypothetical protein
VNQIVTGIEEVVISDGGGLILDSDTPWMFQDSGHADKAKEPAVPIVFFGMDLVIAPRIAGVLRNALCPRFQRRQASRYVQGF